MSKANTIVKLGRYPFRCTVDEEDHSVYKGWFWLDGSVGEPFASSNVFVERDGDQYSATLTVGQLLTKEWDYRSLDALLSALDDWFSRDTWSFELYA